MPALYILVEEGQREFLAKLLVARIAVERGYDAIVGQQWLINYNLAKLPPGIVLAKGMNKAQASLFGRARACGHLVAANEEEAFALCDRREILRLCDPTSAASCNLVLAQSELHRDVLSERFDDPASRIAVVGNPRADLLRPEFHGLYEAERRVIAAEHGRFILLNTNFGSVNSHFGDCLEYFGVCVQTGVVDPTDPTDMATFAEWCDWETRNFAEVVRFLDDLKASGRRHKVIVRPHPSEKLDVWNEVAARRPGLAVIRSGNHVPWMLASDLLIHTGCTTGMEAFIAGRPAVSLCPGTTRWHDIYVSNRINPRVASGAEAVEFVRRVVDAGDVDPLRRNELDARAERFIAATDGPLAAERMVDALDRLRMPQMPDRPWMPLPGFVGAVTRTDMQVSKFTATVADVTNDLARLAACAGRFADIAVVPVGESLFHLSRQAPTAKYAAP